MAEGRMRGLNGRPPDPGVQNKSGIWTKFIVAIGVFGEMSSRKYVGALIVAFGIAWRVTKSTANRA